MQAEFVIAVCDVKCSWGEHTPPPRYRCYVNDELFAERTWIWRDAYLEESLQILAEPGRYQVTYQLVDPEDAEIHYTNLRVAQGPAVISPRGEVHVYTPKR